jgi:hypothetical protein
MSVAALSSHDIGLYFFDSPGFGEYTGECFTLDPREGSYVETEISREFPDLRLLEEEPEAWSKCVDRKVSFIFILICLRAQA